MTIDQNAISLLSLIVASLSFLLALVTSISSYRLQKRDDERAKELSEIQLKLQGLQLQKEEADAERRSSSIVEARHVSIGSKGHRLRVSNTGGTVATDITCEYDKDNGPYAFIQDKEPYERLEPGESFDESIIRTGSSPSKFIVITHWVDSDGEKHSRENIVSW